MNHFPQQQAEAQDVDMPTADAFFDHARSGLAAAVAQCVEDYDGGRVEDFALNIEEAAWDVLKPVIVQSYRNGRLPAGNTPRRSRRRQARQ